jgi:SAM-dependent methyltransferase
MYFLKLTDVARFRQTFDYLENYQKRFIYSTPGSNYRWSNSPLREWSRCCEYPFIYETLKKFATPGCSILDFGSGKNFLPILLSEEGFNVNCLDLDDYSEFYKNNSSNERTVVFTTDITSLSGKYDVVYSVSVLEHTPDIIAELESIKTRLADNGLLLLTLDADVRGDLTISMDKLSKVTDYLAANFNEIDLALNGTGPLLTYVNSPFGFWGQSFTFILRRFIRSFINTLTNSKPERRWVMPYDLRVGLYVGVKR